MKPHSFTVSVDERGEACIERNVHLLTTHVISDAGILSSAKWFWVSYSELVVLFFFLHRKTGVLLLVLFCTCRGFFFCLFCFVKCAVLQWAFKGIEELVFCLSFRPRINLWERSDGIAWEQTLAADEFLGPTGRPTYTLRVIINVCVWVCVCVCVCVYKYRG